MKHTGRSGGSSSAGRKVLNVLLAFLLIFLILVLIGMGYTLRMLGKMNYVTQEATISPEELEKYLAENIETRHPGAAEEEIILDAVPGDVIEGENIIHILLIGEDARPGESRGRSDAMILCSINTAEKKLIVTSFMRDLYVTIPGYTDHKLNSAYAWGGMKLLNETIRFNFGIEIDGNVAVNFETFQKVISLLGGVEIDLTAEEARYLGCTEGVNRLNGSTALAYARIRSIGEGDFDRTDRQRKVIGALLEKCKAMPIGQLHGLLGEILPLMVTNMEETEILQYGLEVLPLLASGCEMEKLCIPAEGKYRYAWAKDMSVLLPDLEKNREILRRVLS